MTTKQLARWIGQTRTVELGGLDITVSVTDAREVFGRIDLQVTPHHGSGSVWVAADRTRSEGMER